MMKRNISDLLDDLQHQPLEMELDTPLSSQRIKELTMSKISKKTRRSKRIAFRVLVAAAVIVTMTLTIFAAEEIMTYDNWFEDFFSGKSVIADISENQLQMLDQSIAKLDQSVKRGGYTVTLKTALTDGYAAYLSFRIDAPEGKVLGSRWYGFDKTEMELFGKSADDGEVNLIGSSWINLDDGNPMDNSASLLYKVSISDPEGWTASMVDGEEKTITLKKIWEYVSDELPSEIISEGEWSFRFSFADSGALTQEVEMLSSPVRCTGRRWLGQHTFDVAVKVTSFRLRGLTATCCFEKPLTGYWEGILLDPIYVVLKDGSRIEAHFKIGSTIRDGSYESQYDFDVPISFADVDYVEFPGGDKAYLPE